METEKNTDIADEDVSQALLRIISTTDFKKAYRLRQLLEHLINKHLAGEEGDLKGYNLGLDVFDKGKDFDPDTDTIVRVQMVRLRRMLEHYYLTDGKDEPIIIEIPKGRYIPAYRKKPDLPQSSSYDDIPTNEEIFEDAEDLFHLVKRRVLGDRFLTFLVVGLVALFSYLVSSWVSSSLAPTKVAAQKNIMKREVYSLPTGPSIAVFPFNNETQNQAHTALIRGFPAHIIHALSRYKDLFILAPDTTLAVRARPQQNLDKARELNATYILSGGFGINGDNINVSAFLRDAQSGKFIWTKDYAKHLTGANLHEIQNNIASSVARETGQPYGIINRIETLRRKWTTTKSFSAYECVLRFFEYAQDENAAQHRVVRDCLEEATRTSPKYAQAWAALSWIYVDEHRHGFNPKSATEPPLDRALRAARKAVVLDPDDAFNFQHLATTLVSRGNISGAHDAIMKASRLNPNDAAILADVAWITKNTGQIDKAFMYAQKAIRLNPGHPPWYLETPFLYYYKSQDCKQSFETARTYHFLTPKSVLREVFPVVSGMLCKGANIEKYVTALNTRYALFKKQPHQVLRDHAIPEELIDDMIAHLKEAGVKLGG